MDIVFDEAAGKILKEEDWWFESEEGTLLKWYVHLFSPCLRILVNADLWVWGFTTMWFVDGILTGHAL